MESGRESRTCGFRLQAYPPPNISATRGSYRDAIGLKLHPSQALPFHAINGHEAERAALITMTSFHPWILVEADAGPFAAYAGALRLSGLTWQEALREWLDGGLSCAEAKRYVGNFLSVYRIRPQIDDNDDAHSSDMATDEELEVSHAALQEAFETRVRGRECEEGLGDDDAEGAASQQQNSTTGITQAQGVWGCERPGTHELLVGPTGGLGEPCGA